MKLSMLKKTQENEKRLYKKEVGVAYDVGSPRIPCRGYVLYSYI